VTLPGDAGGARVDGVEALAVAGADGPTRVVGFQLRVDQGQSRTAVVRFTLPGDHGTVRVEPSARVPATTWTGPGDAWTDVTARTIAFAAP
jgi:hypothetical protein